jgi:hypothetical protein
MKRLLASAAIASVAALGVPIGVAASASAASPNTPPGSAVAHDRSVCADHGGFGGLGQYGVGVNKPGSNGRPGATSWMFPNSNTGSTTGGNNNSLCGGGNVPPPYAGP